MTTNLPRPEYPRPQLTRPEWLNLNGTWSFAYDDANVGINERWKRAKIFSREITVPFAFQSKLSGINDPAFHDVVWYQRKFDVPKDWRGKRVLIHFGAVDYKAYVWLNGELVICHEGGNTPFSADITELLLPDEPQSIVVRAEDPSRDLSQPRGKQYWEVESAAIFYTRTTGIWQTVWLEPVASTHVSRLKITPDVDANAVQIDYVLSKPDADVQLETLIRFDGKLVQARTHDAASQTFTLDSASLRLWSPETPNLYDVTVRVLQDGGAVDTVESYFGMRKIAVRAGKVELNNQPYTMRLVLDQGYHPDGLLTFPSDEAIKADVEVTKAMGFNGARKHQKVEEPRYHYWADKLGLLVWGEMANSYLYTEQSVRQLTQEWQEAVARDYNHPCIVAWVPLNESWGVPDIPNDPRQANWLFSLYHLTKALDPTRLVISNDGWEHAKSDLLTIHDYTGDEPTLRERYGSVANALLWTPGKHALYVPGVEYSGEPILVTEFGGIAFRVAQQEGWGYTSASDAESFAEQLSAVFRPLHDSSHVQGFCYTQLTDVEQEINGLLTYDRVPKLDVSKIRAIVTGSESAASG